MSMEQTRQENSMRDIGVLLMVIVVAGPLIGVAAASLSLLLEMTQHVMLGGVECVAHPEGVSLPIRRVVSILVASFVAAVIWWLIRRRHTIPSVGQAVHGKSMPVLASLVHIIAQIFIVGSGLSIGRETAPRELGALIGQKLSGLLRVSTQDMALITACCAGAGFAGVYDAPLAGMFFAVEMLLVDVSIRTVGVALGTSVIAAFSSSLIRGNAASDCSKPTINSYVYDYWPNYGSVRLFLSQGNIMGFAAPNALNTYSVAAAFSGNSNSCYSILSASDYGQWSRLSANRL